MYFKRYFYLVAGLILAACTSDDTVDNPLFIGDTCLRGTGPVTTELRDLGNFTGIISSIPANVIITQGLVEPVRIDAPTNVLSALTTTVNNNSLNIRIDECIEDLGDVNIFVTIPDIELLVLAGVGNMNTSEAIDVDNLDISLTGVGNFSLKGTADNLDINLTGVGDVDAFQFVSDVCDISISGAGNAEVSVNDELNVIITGVGSVFFLGMPTVTSTITGDGSVIDVN